VSTRDNTNLLLILGVLLLVGGGGYAVYTMTRGLRNNNPFNLEDDGVTAWEGLATPRNDGPYLVFTNASYGIRAGGKNVSNYVLLDGISPTIAELITRFAPPTENDTAAYIADVASQLGVDPNAALNIPGGDLLPLAKAIISHENGLNPYSDAMIAAALNLA
jgi:hypothetical protein